MKMVLKTCAIATGLLLVCAGTAVAGYSGEGLYGEADDKVVTFFGLGLVILFPLIAAIGSILQGRLERRKEERVAAASRSRAIRR